MVRFTDAMLGNAELEERHASRSALEEEQMRKFFLERVRQDPLLDGQNYIYMHYADMIANGYHRHRALPVPDPGHDAEPERRPVLLREQRGGRATSSKEDPEAIYFREAASSTASTFATRSARRASARAR